MSVYNITGEKIDASKESNINYDSCVLSVNHRGYSTVAPENTLPAYILSKKYGFNYVETDISFTSDGIPVLLHDSTINRTSNGTGNISQLTFAQVRQYDFGAWKSYEYAGTLIPTLEEFLSLCKSIMLHPYLELKSNGDYTQEQIQQIVDMVNSHGLKGKVTYISFSSTFLGYIKDYDASARLGFLAGTYSQDHITICKNLKTPANNVFYDVKSTAITQAVVDSFSAQNIPMEAWTIDSEQTILALNKYVSGITSNNLIAGKTLYNNYMGD